MSKQQDRDGFMTKGRVQGSVGRNSIPRSVLARSPLIASYVDHFSIATDVRATPEQYARAMFGDVPSAAEVFIWRGLLQLRLSTGASPHAVAGWRIVENSGSWVRLEARSHSLTVHLVIYAENDELALTTFVRYDRTFGRWTWRPLSAIHRALAPSLLLDAIARTQAC